MCADDIKIVRIFNYTKSMMIKLQFFLTKTKFYCYKTLGFNGFIYLHSAGLKEPRFKTRYNPLVPIIIHYVYEYDSITYIIWF